LPSFFTTWSKVAWGTLFRSLPDEEQVDEECASASEEFRQRVSDALHTQVTLGTSKIQGQQQITFTERLSLIAWCARFMRSGPWKPIRSYAIWTRAANENLEVALRVELFSSGQANCRPLANFTQNRFGRLCELYGVGYADRAQGQRAVILAH